MLPALPINRAGYIAPRIAGPNIDPITNLCNCESVLFRKAVVVPLKLGIALINYSLDDLLKANKNIYKFIAKNIDI